MLYRNTLIFSAFICVLLLLFIGMKQLTAFERREMLYHTQALDRADHLIEMMKSNHTAARLGAYDMTHRYQVPVCKPCGKTEQAKIDVLNWELGNQLKLPQGTGQVAYDGSKYTITINWRSKHYNSHCKKQGYNCINILFDPNQI